MLTVKEFAFSASSACHSGSGAVSPILAAIGLEVDLAGCSVRFGLGKSTTQEQVESLCAAVDRAARRIRGPVAGPSPARAV
jgi:cysteine desulfurase